MNKLMPKEEKWYLKIAFISVFYLILLTPFIQEQLSIFTVTPVIENRKKAERPEGIFNIFSAHGDYASKYEKYFNDTYGLRDFLIKLKNQIDYSFFKLSDEILIGKDGFIFYKSVYENQVPLVEKNIKAFDKLFHRLQKLNSNLKDRGITLILIMAPHKSTIYPEKLDTTYPIIPSPSGFFRLDKFLKEHPEIVTLKVYEKLMAIKTQIPVFHKTDFHWNDPAGAIILKDFIDLLGTLPDGKNVTWDVPLEIRLENQTGGGEINSLATLFPPLEDMLMVKNDPSIGFGELKSAGRANEWVYTANEKTLLNEKLLPTTVLFGDSYADAFLRSGLTRPFSKLYKFYNLEFASKFKEIPVDTKFVVLENIESNLGSMLSDVYWPEELR